MRNLIKHPVAFCGALFFFFLFSSCNHDESTDSASKETVLLSVSVTGITESDENTEITRNNSNDSHQQMITTIPLGNNIAMEATMTRNTAITRATTVLAAEVRYRVIAFKKGKVNSMGYINHCDYVAGTTGTAPEFILPAGVTYTFVCYSFNTTKALPAFNKNALDIAANPVTSDLLYAKFDKTITATDKALSFSFVPKFSEVTVVADATGLKKNISDISTYLSPNYSATLAVSTGELTSSGTATAHAIPWGTIAAAQTVTSNTCMMFTNASSAMTINIPSITIEGVTRTGLTARFSSTTMQPGNKYTLILAFKGESTPAGVLEDEWATKDSILNGGIQY